MDMREDIKDGMHIDHFGTKHWCLNGEPHRLDGPAVEYKDGDNYWYKYGLKHRIGGPAVTLGNMKMWYLYNTKLTEEHYEYVISNLPLLYWLRFKRGEWV
jgi:hypothetical protein